MSGCSVEDCSGGVFAAGLCAKHYHRKRKYGTFEGGSQNHSPLEERFWRYVNKKGPDDCWNWLGSGVDGYGSIGLGGRKAGKVLAHRVSWEIHNGKIPDSEDYHGVVVRHRCNNRACVNPNHLKLGTQADNVQDMWVNKGGRRGNARLTESQIAAIKSDPRSSRQLAPIYGVSDAHIRAIRSGRTWKTSQ